MWFGTRIHSCIAIGETEFPVRTGCCISKTRLVDDLVLVCELHKGFDCLLLREDAVRLFGVALGEPPSTFFWSTVPEDGFVERDRGWFFVFELDVRLVVTDGPTCFPGVGVELAEAGEIRHLSSVRSVVMIQDINAIMIVMMS